MVNKLSEVNQELINYFKNDFFCKLKFTGRDNFKADCSYLYFIFKSTKLFKAVQILCDSSVGDGETSIILVRGLFELLVDLKYINADDKFRARRQELFHDAFIRGPYHKINECNNCDYKKTDPKICDKCHFDIWAEGLNKILKKYYPPDNPTLNKCLKEFEAELGLVKAGKNHKMWSGKNRKQMAYECGLLRSYLIFYWSYSNLAHPSLSNMPNFLLIDNAYSDYKKIDNLIENGPQAIKNVEFSVKNPLDTSCDKYVTEALSQAFNYYSQILEEISRIYDPKLNDKLNLIIKKHPFYHTFEKY